MPNIPIALIFDEQHDQKAISLIRNLQDVGCDVLRCTQYTPPNVLSDHIKHVDHLFLLVISDAPFPYTFAQSIDDMLVQARNRDKNVYIIKEYNAALPPDFQGYPVLEPRDGNMNAPRSGDIAGMICNLVMRSENKKVLFEKLNNLIAIEYTQGIQETLSDLMVLLCTECLEYSPSDEEAIPALTDTLRIFEKAAYYSGLCETREIACKMERSAGYALKLAEAFRHTTDMFCLACLLRLLEFYHIIWADGIEARTYGDVLLHNKPLPDIYTELAKSFLALSETLLQNPNERNDRYSAEQVAAILDQRDRSHLLLTPEQERSPKEALISILTRNIPKPTATAIVTDENEETLRNIAEYMHKGYMLFNSLADDAAAADFLRGLKTGFERLKNYCDIMEIKPISAQCIDYIARIDRQLAHTPDEQMSTNKPNLGLKALLGLKMPKDIDYDVFLSYKHEDRDIVRNIYHYLNSRMLNAFFDTVSLPELSESDYAEAIMNALDRSHHFLVVITDLKQLNTHWIKLEMKTFHHEMMEGRKSNANFIMLVTDTVYHEILSSNKAVLPIQYRSCEIMKISEYQSILYKYLTK